MRERPITSKSTQYRDGKPRYCLWDTGAQNPLNMEFARPSEKGQFIFVNRFNFTMTVRPRVIGPVVPKMATRSIASG
jgi:hypothetical protein